MRALLGAFVLVVASAAAAHAYPQFQFSVDGAQRCNACHVGPAGGGLINAYGRDSAEDMGSSPGDGRWAYGAKLPGWLSLGVDTRAGAIVSHIGDSTKPIVVPMLADVYAAAHGGAFTAYVAAGARGVARPEGQNPASYLVSRQHWVMWQPDKVGPYARVGRFFAPYGLRLVDHTAFVRRFLDTNTLEETYGLGAGWIADAFEVHATGFVGDPLLAVGQKDAVGAAVTAAVRLGKLAEIGVSGRHAAGEPVTRTMGGLTGKLWLAPAKLQLLGEVDLVSQKVDGFDATSQLASYVGATVFPMKGWMFGASWGRWQPDLEVAPTVRDSFDAQATWFLKAHWELIGVFREQVIDGGDGGPSSTMGMVQLHYWL